jgi:hypothetical protein
LNWQVVPQVRNSVDEYRDDNVKLERFIGDVCRTDRRTLSITPTGRFAHSARRRVRDDKS